MPNPYVQNRLEAIQQALVAHHRGGAGMPNGVVGSEREHLISIFLAQVMPSIYRFGRGCITDGQGLLSGQLDLVIELPFAPNFPMPTGNERLYLAESVLAVIEVKSNLSKQWGEVEATVRKVKQLLPKLMNVVSVSTGTPKDPRIPVYAIGYTGYSTANGLEERLKSTEENARPVGALVIDSGVVSVPKYGRLGHGPWGLYVLIYELLQRAQNALLMTPEIARYV